MRRQVDAHLGALARGSLEAPRRSRRFPPSDAVAGVVRTLSQLYAERGVTFAVDVDPALQVLVAREDLDELIPKRSQLLDQRLEDRAQPPAQAGAEDPLAGSDPSRISASS